MEYAAPELVSRNSNSGAYTLSTAQDVWSLGIVFYAVLFADLPWSAARHDDPDFHSSYGQDGLLEERAPWNLLSGPLMALMRRMLAIDPAQRAAFPLPSHLLTIESAGIELVYTGATSTVLQR